VAPGGRFLPSVITQPDDASTIIHAAFAALEARLVDQARADQTRLLERIDSRTSAPSTNSNSSRQRRGNRGTPARTPNTNYCWTHGWIVGAEHTSSTCQHPSDGHVRTATRANPHGGSSKNKEKVVDL
jgi:hypothetical protein